VPTTRTEQAVRVKQYIVTSINYFATHAELRLSRLRCDGTLAWTSVTTGDKEHYGSNAQSAVSDSVGQAIGRALDAYAARPAEAAPAAPAPPAAVANGKKVAIVPFTQLGSAADPSLDFATEEARKRYAARGADVVVTAPADHLVATKDSAALCARYGASSLVMGTVRTEQTPRFSEIATHAEVMLTTVACNGQVVGTQDAIGEQLHHGANFRAGVSSAIEDAFGHWAEAQPKT
jgi:pyruvate/2-oxoglutarate dehydrogenase complex dihydrolipoamide acyltransferase (E2) component